MAKITRITASTALDFACILRLLTAFGVVRGEDFWKCHQTCAIVVAAPIEKVEAALRRYLGSVDYPYTNFQLETQEEWENGNQVP